MKNLTKIFMREYIKLDYLVCIYLLLRLTKKDRSLRKAVSYRYHQLSNYSCKQKAYNQSIQASANIICLLHIIIIGLQSTNTTIGIIHAIHGIIDIIPLPNIIYGQQTKINSRRNEQASKFWCQKERCRNYGI